jgi:hypothetical protein
VSAIEGSIWGAIATIDIELPLFLATMVVHLEIA